MIIIHEHLYIVIILNCVIRITNYLPGIKRSYEAMYHELNNTEELE